MYGKTKKMMMSGGMVDKAANGGLVEQKAKRPNPYTGNVPEAADMEKETRMADGGMAGKKPAVMAIVARLAKKPMSESKKMNEEMEDEGKMEMGEARMEAKKAAAEEIMGALKSGDTSTLASSLENFMRACGED